MKRRLLLLSTALCGALAQPAQALPPLSENRAITEGLIAVGMALELGENCPDLSPRMVRGLFYLNGLKGQARDAGYSDAQIDAFVQDAGQKARLEDAARTRLRALGVQDDLAESYCTVGRAQIAADTAAGRLLKD